MLRRYLELEANRYWWSLKFQKDLFKQPTVDIPL